VVCVLLVPRASSKLPKVDAMSTKAANKLVSFKMWLKWNALKRKEVESDRTAAQSRSQLVCESKGCQPQQSTILIWLPI